MTKYYSIYKSNHILTISILTIIFIVNNQTFQSILPINKYKDTSKPLSYSFQPPLTYPFWLLATLKHSIFIFGLSTIGNKPICLLFKFLGKLCFQKLCMWPELELWELARLIHHNDTCLFSANIWNYSYRIICNCNYD